MKSYKDLDREIILNTPEGAMWVAHAKDEDDTNMYYKVKNGRLLVNCYASWGTSSNNSIAQAVLRESGFEFIPLPNIEIPWEVTEDSVCPVPDGCNTVFYTNSNREGFPTDAPSYAVWGSGSGITKYKIIDEDYLSSASTVTITEDSATIESGVNITVWETKEEQLINRLKFLQNLANEFPEIYDEVVAEMKVQFECYCEENLND